MKQYKSDAAIIMLNFYPPEIVGRAIDSIRRQSFQGTWTLYLGFHHRTPSHIEAVRTLCTDMTVHFVNIKQDMVFDMRARDIILQEALRFGDHRFLYFLDDDDEWYPDYLAKMTATGAPFVTSAKNVMDDEIGQISTLQGDFDFESMGFWFDDWQGRHLPYFVKQGGDKFLYREFHARYPDHPVITEPLHLVHRHSTSMTYQKTLGRNNQKDELFEKDIWMVGSVIEKPLEMFTWNALAAALDTPLLSQKEMLQQNTPPQGIITTFDDLPACLDFRKFSSTQFPVITVCESNPHLLGLDRSENRTQLEILQQTDAVLLAEPLWVDAYEAFGLKCIPAGFPWLSSEEIVVNRWLEKSRQPIKKVIWLGSMPNQTEEITHPHGMEWLDSIQDADVAISTGTISDWGAEILYAFTWGVPCICTSQTSIARILYGGSDILLDEINQENILQAMKSLMEWDRKNFIESALPFYRRNFSTFYWLNYFTAYLKAYHVL
jgi:hypothetical protein